MESGAFVNVYTFSWGMNVLVHLLGQDFDKTTGKIFTLPGLPVFKKYSCIEIMELYKVCDTIVHKKTLL